MARLLVDNDVFIKAAHWGFLDHLPTLISGSWSDVSGVESLAFRARRADPKLFREVSIAGDLSARLALTAPLPAPNIDVVRALQGVVGLDPGEVVLISALYDDPDATLVTGDKRALAALAGGDFSWILDRIRGRVVCMEQFVEHALSVLGPEALVKSIHPYRSLDTAMRIVIGSGESVDVVSLREGLTSYINDVRRASGDVLRP